MKKFYCHLAVFGALLALTAVVNTVMSLEPILGGGIATAMAVVQSAYSERMKVATAGMVANMRDFDSITRNCETAAGIGFGLAVSLGANKESGCVLGGALTVFRSVSMRDVTVDNTTTADEYAENQNVGILTQGEIWVQVTGSPDPSDPVHYDTTTGIFAASGGAGPVRGARWMGETDAALSIARLYLSGDAQAAA